MSNYPPGVTGREFQIAGPDTQAEAIVDCPNCGQVEVIVSTYQFLKTWQCDCGYEYELDEAPDDDPLGYFDEDRADEARFEARYG